MKVQVRDARSPFEPLPCQPEGILSDKKEAVLIPDTFGCLAEQQGSESGQRDGPAMPCLRLRDQQRPVVCVNVVAPDIEDFSPPHACFQGETDDRTNKGTSALSGSFDQPLLLPWS